MSEATALSALRELGFSQHERGDLGAAEQSYRAVLQRTPGDLEIAHALGILAIQCGRYGEAAVLIEPVVAGNTTAAANADLGNALHGLSRLEEALHSYDRALQMQPDYVDAHLNRARVLQRLGRPEEALAGYDAAIAAAPQLYEAHLGRADLLRELGRPAEAIGGYLQSVGLRTDLPLGYVKLASALLEAGRWEDALRSVDRAVTLGEDSAEAFTARGLALAGVGRGDDALKSYHRAIELRSDYAPAHINRGILLRERGRLEEALASHEAALAADGGSYEALSNRAAVLVDLGRFDEALADCDRAAMLRPDAPEMAVRRAVALTGLERLEEALACYDRAIGRWPDHAAAHAGKAGILQHLRRHTEALASADRAVALDSRVAAAHFNRGAAQRDLMRIEEAVRSLETARSLQPEDAQTNANLGGLYLLQGRLEEGWELYEWRSRLPEAPKIHRYSQPRWRGEEDIAGRSLFVYVDQGLGDTIQFARYARLAELRGARVMMSVQNSLHRLLSTLSPTIQILAETQAPAAFDLHCPLASLPRAFRTTLESIPAGGAYLAAESERVASWRRRLGAEGFKVGICWQGSTIKTGFGRSFELRELEHIAAIPGVRLISLQRGAGVEQIETVSQDMRVEVLGDEFDAGPHAFLDSAAVLEALDLVITCDTSIAHVAGALGRPAWVVLKQVPDWRWLLGRDDNPWYSSLRLFRQTRDGRWSDVFAAMHDALRQRLESARAG
jgi:tetratricopeptide (TPR) repeat protein